jgi:hypothetical protein
MPTPNTDTPQGPTLEDAARAFEGMLDREDGTPATEEPAAEEVPASPDGASESVAAEAEPEETPAGDAAAESEEADASELDGPETAESEESLITVRVDGKTEQIPLTEVVKGYQRHADYTRSTQALASERQKFAAEQQAVREERETYATMLRTLQDQLQTGGEPEPDWDEVFRTDPLSYARKRDQWRDKQEKVAAANYELQRLQVIKQQEQVEALKKTVESGRQRMNDLVPAWKDQATWDADRQKIVDYAQKIAGYSTEEINQAYDPRAVVLLHKARLYDELLSNRPKPTVAKGPRVASAGVVRPQGSSARLNQAQQRLAKSGRLQDAAKVWEQLL